MKYYLLLVASLFTVNVIAQKKAHKKVITPKPAVPIKPAEYAIVQGHIKNYNSKSLQIGYDDLLDFTFNTLPVDAQGNYAQKIAISDLTRSIYFPNAGIVLKLIPRDTVTVDWDNQNSERTLTIKTSSELRTAELRKAFDQRIFHSNFFYTMRNGLYTQKLTDSAKFQQINDGFNKEIEHLLSNDTHHLVSKMAVDVYFDYANLLLGQSLLPKYELYLKSDAAKQTIAWVNDPSRKPYKLESEEYYKTSGEYRRYIFDYLRLSRFIDRTSVINNNTSATHKYSGMGPAYNDYYSGMANLHITEIRDWFITKSIFTDFEFYDFADASYIYNDFKTRVETPYYADTLKKFYTGIQRLKPGSPAPIFRLKNEEGREVSLSEFRGKVVYIDFWGVHCAPCIIAIKNHIPALHEKYKDNKNVVFINICIDVDENTWKQSIKDLKLTGVNLLAEGGTRNPASKAYNVSAIPSYFLISKSGKLAGNKDKGPATGISGDIDKLLSSR